MDNELKGLLSLNGTRTLLTGAFGGLGFGILNSFLENGQHVTATSRHNHEKFNANKAVEIVKVDLNDEEAVTSFAKNTEPFDNVVLCHGISGLRPIPMLTPAYSREILQTNFVSKTHLVSALIKNKKISSPGRLVNVSSISAHYGSKHVAIYSSSNAASESFMRSVGKAFLKKKITVNSVAVNAIWTPVFEGLSADNPVFDTPLGQGEVVDVANAVFFLCQNGSNFITGETLFLTGGQMEYDD